eukprot:CAMPEP_0176014878 /NCGR_PEP_ID=MMETSP0120_2-20121206/7048_1 /TAXON_ID=160619 /ORGANISM="Kryptoperidinium foliaceum, Strain CCMP 1326" /LENGTH=1749 /DNA_ID=CAMNT_0017347829 /DNA_START=181 /DNA_END=5427 /DNA_ORIENTATION=+
MSTGIGGLSSPTTSAAAPDPSEFWDDDFRPLQSAGTSILKALREDETSPQGDLYRRILSTAASTSTSASSNSTGLDPPPNHHYFPNGHWKHSQSVPLPAYLQEQMHQAKMATLMGLFEEAQMAWMTMDDTIYLWSYHSSGTENDFLYFQVPSKQPIVSAGLARPKAGVFTSAVEWCLVVTTKEEAMLCALARKQHQQLTAIPTKFVIPSDWVSFLSVTSTKDGRIFLGGQDGNLYELDYDLLLEAHDGHALDVPAQLDAFYDGSSGVCPAQLSDVSAAPSILESGKRAFNSILNSSRQPPRKCRKLNHSQSAFSSLMPDFVRSLTSAIFGDSTTTGAGPIVQMVVDEERQVLYTLSSRGWICALDIAEKPKVTLCATLDTPATARLYLEAVSRGRMYPPSTSAHNREGNLKFPGGGEAAQAGVGGMEGARRILKMVEQAKAAQGRRGRQPPNSILTPQAIEVVPTRESTRITLVAIAAGGMRYYLTSLHENTLGTGPAPQPFGTPRHRQSIKPHSRMTFCHIRAPPSLSDSDTNNTATSYSPNQPADQKVDAACYRLGVFFAAFQKLPTNTTTTPPPVGNVLVVASADSRAMEQVKSNQKENNNSNTAVPTNTVTYLTPGGVCETVSFPLALTNRSGTSNTNAVLPGGRIWQICMETSQNAKSKVLGLALRSKTPTDAELGYGMAPAYVPPSKRASKKNNSSDSKALATSQQQSATSLALSIMTNLLLSRPVKYGIDQGNGGSESSGKSATMYRISNRIGADGFSLSAADSKAGAGVGATRSARLSPWLLAPEVVPLSPMALQYLEASSTSFLALNAGGLHEIQCPSALQQLASLIMSAGANARTDPNVTKFFEEYGYAEGCAMCFFLAMHPTSSKDLKEYAMRAALSRAYRPNLAQSGTGQQATSNDPWVPIGYTFSSSALYDGLTLAVARLLRPFWHKPAVVVTEGRVVKRGFSTTTTPAKVELLLDDDVIDEILGPLDSMQQVIRRVFSKAVENVPLSRNASSNDEMEIDGDNYFLTRMLEFQRRGQNQGGPSAVLGPSEANELAHHIEERNIHCLYRLVSRSSQLLELLSHLRRAHSMPDLPEVDWGQLHGISAAQLVQTREGQERLESTLNSLVTSASVKNTSAEAKEVASVLSEQCYYFFSAGSRFAYFGFQSAQDALYTPPEQRSRRIALTNDAVDSLRNAAKYWYSPSLITGRLLRTSDDESYDKIAERALRCDSPLAKACDLLFGLDEVAALVEICWYTSANFQKKSTSTELVTWRNPSGEYHWEKGLYHRRQNPNEAPSSSSSTAMGTNVVAEDAIKTCHALVFYYLTKLLDSPFNTDKYRLGEDMVAVCAAADDNLFLHRFYEQLLQTNHTDVLLRINSPSLEKWLAAEKKDNLELLLRYYQIQEKNVEAGQVAWQHANRADADVDLNERIEYLVQAVDCFNRALTLGQGDRNDVHFKVKQSEERLSIARLQGRVLQSIPASKYEVSQETTKELQFTLLTASRLLNEFAMPYDLYESCLLILHACKHSESQLIEQLWKSILCEEVFPCTTKSEQAFRALRGFSEGSFFSGPTIQINDGSESASLALFEDGHWMKTLEGTVIRLGEEVYGPSGEKFAFPVEFITQCLEELRLAYGLAAGKAEAEKTQTWALTVLVSAGVEHVVALRGYEAMVERQNHSAMGVDPSKRLEQIQVVISMLESFEAAAKAGRVVGASSAAEQMLDAYNSGAILGNIDDYRSQLQNLPVDVTAEERRLSFLES